MNPKVIVIDGKTYQSVNEMPPEVREKYEQAMQSLGGASSNRIPDAFETASSETVNLFADKDKNGIPDILENTTTGSTVMSTMKIVMDGKEFNGIQDLPPEARAKYEEAMGKLDANRNGIPDFVEGMLNATNQTTNVSTSFGTGSTRPSAPLEYAQSQPLPVSPTITPDTSNGWMLALLGIALLGLCLLSAAGIWYFFLR